MKRRAASSSSGQLRPTSCPKLGQYTPISGKKHGKIIENRFMNKTCRLLRCLSMNHLIFEIEDRIDCWLPFCTSKSSPALMAAQGECFVLRLLQHCRPSIESIPRLFRKVWHLTCRRHTRYSSIEGWWGDPIIPSDIDAIGWFAPMSERIAVNGIQ